MVWFKDPKYDQLPPLEQDRYHDHDRWWSRKPVSLLWIGIVLGFSASSFATLALAKAISPASYTAFLSPPTSSLVGAQNFFPEFSTVEKAFVIDDMEWKNRTSWDREYPYGRGFIEVRDPHSYGLALDEAGTSASFLLSMFHSMHCLERISEVLSGLLERDPSIVQDPPTHHLGHCISYLRQSITCSGDISLEHARRLKGQGAQNVRRDEDAKQRLEDAIHVCRNQDEILAFVGSHGWDYTEVQQKGG